jgi:hypothetical protein
MARGGCAASDRDRSSRDSFAPSISDVISDCVELAFAVETSRMHFLPSRRIGPRCAIRDALENIQGCVHKFFQRRPRPAEPRHAPFGKRRAFLALQMMGGCRSNRPAHDSTIFAKQSAIEAKPTTAAALLCSERNANYGNADCICSWCNGRALHGDRRPLLERSLTPVSRRRAWLIH